MEVAVFFGQFSNVISHFLSSHAVAREKSHDIILIIILAKINGNHESSLDLEYIENRIKEDALSF